VPLPTLIEPATVVFEILTVLSFTAGHEEKSRRILRRDPMVI
jgi:hypothetical protein